MLTQEQRLGDWTSLWLRPWQAAALTWAAWALLLIWVSAGAAMDSKRTVVHNYRQAATDWMNGQPLYNNQGVGFLYLPQAAVLFTPLALGSETLGETLWRALNVALLAVAVYQFSRMAGRWSGAGLKLFPLATLIVIPLSFSSMRSGQSTIIMTATMLLSVVALEARQWWKAAAWISLGVALKPLAVVLALLMLAICSPIRLRLLVCTVVVLLLPFATQRPAYVVGQYEAFVGMLKTASEGGQAALWAQAFDALQLIGVHISSTGKTLLRMAVALAVLAWCWIISRRCSAPRAMIYLFALASTYLVLFNPRTENCTYALIAPALGVFYALAWTAPRDTLAGVGLGLMSLGTVGSYELGRLITPREHSIWLAPLMAACFLAYLAVSTIQDLRHEQDVGQDQDGAKPGVPRRVSDQHRRKRRSIHPARR